ncbi:MAG: hypothetical protein OEY03_03360 [Rhizobacter sp.]|nr:hypothetical protein [Rhizobacter sp.]
MLKHRAALAATDRIVADPARRRLLQGLLRAMGLSVVGAGAGCESEGRWFGRPSVQLPAPLPVPWTMKALATATTQMRTLADGRLYLHIRHDILRGVTPRMLVWWFSHLEGDIEVAGRRWPRYRVWHPVDHIAVRYVRRRPDGSIGPGAQIHIREALGGRLEDLVDVVTTIEKLDETGFVHGLRLLGMEIMRLAYSFTPVAGGTLYENSIIFGPDNMLRPSFNTVLRPRLLPDDRARAWLKHNVEEVGNFEHFLPGLYARETAARAASR